MSAALPTIYALSSGAPPAAISIVRVSGSSALAAARLFNFAVPPPREARLTSLRDDDGSLLDRAVVLFFPAPHSATGETIFELHLHGGRALSERVLARLSTLPDFRAAEPGEFTRRAVLNGRMDLLEAEALGELLVAETEAQRRLAMRSGTLIGDALRRWDASLLRLAAALEAAIDHDAEDPGIAWEDDLRTILRDMRSMLDRPETERIRDGLRVIIAGPPNAGKSTLMNAIVGESVAITSERPGTTRDMIEVPLAIGGVAVRLSDSPGLRDADDPVERIGIARARDRFADADLLLWMDRGAPPVGARAIQVASKADICGDDPDADIVVSGLTGAGLPALMQMMIARLAEILPGEGEAALNRRQRIAVGELLELLSSDTLECELAIRAEAVRGARMVLARLTGRSLSEDLLDAVFQNFCLGK